MFCTESNGKIWRFQSQLCCQIIRYFCRTLYMPVWCKLPENDVKKMKTCYSLSGLYVKLYILYLCIQWYYLLNWHGKFIVQFYSCVHHTIFFQTISKKIGHGDLAACVGVASIVRCIVCVSQARAYTHAHTHTHIAQLCNYENCVLPGY